MSRVKRPGPLVTRIPNGRLMTVQNGKVMRSGKALTDGQMVMRDASRVIRRVVEVAS